MKESPSPSPSPAARSPGQQHLANLSKGAQRVKDMAVDLAADVADGYRKSTRYFKLRLAVVGGWALLSLLTMWLACRSTGPTNSLGAEVRIQETLLGTQVWVENTSPGMWTDVTLTLDGEWQWQAPTFREGQHVVVATSSFAKNGVAAPGDLKPRTVAIRCAEGRATVTPSERSP